MSEHLPAPLDRYTVEVRRVRGSRRVDIEAVPVDRRTPDRAAGWLTAARRFFSGMDALVDKYRGDPIATGQALARIETLMTDLRYLRDRLRDTTAASLNDHGIRRLTVNEVVTIEASSIVNRTDWQHLRLLTAVMEGWRVIDDTTGEVLAPDEAADALLVFFRPEWRLTPLRVQGIEPDDYCTIEKDEDGKVVRTPTVKIADNRTKWSER